MCAHQLRVPTHSQKHLQGSDTHTDGPSDGSPVLQNQRLVSVRVGGSICCSTIETVLDGLGVRDPGGFLHIWQCLALLP
ncbi:hypothetical protein JOQ06_009117, partial [Pogonophryne albipinna]